MIPAIDKAKKESRKTFYGRWNNNEAGYTNNGSFQTTILQAYRLADSSNREILENAYPYWFTIVEPTPTPTPQDSPQTIDITPTYKGLVRVLVELATNATTAEARKMAWGELYKMATAADLWNEHCKINNL